MHTKGLVYQFFRLYVFFCEKLNVRNNQAVLVLSMRMSTIAEWYVVF